MRSFTSLVFRFALLLFALFFFTALLPHGYSVFYSGLRLWCSGSSSSDATASNTEMKLNSTTATSVTLNRHRWHRRLLGLDRVGDGRCSAADITILQGEANPLPDGIPTFTVQIFNGCEAGGGGTCGALSHVHVACGWWATVKLVNPAVFRRLAFNDCIVNDGRPLRPGQLLTFQYANSFQYPLTVKSVTPSCT